MNATKLPNKPLNGACAPQVNGRALTDEISMGDPFPKRPEATWRATYVDQFGEESITVVTDGNGLRTTIRGLALDGPSPDSLSGVDRSEQSQRRDLKFDGDGYLAQYAITLSMPVTVVGESGNVDGVIVATWDSRPGQKPQSGTPILKVEMAGQLLIVPAGDEEYESAIPKIEKQLPGGTFLKTCFNCQFSDYHVAGNMAFGSMYCFRRLKAEYLAVRSKIDYMKLDDSKVEGTQETYLCPEFLRRTPGTGYRG
jgi:hypothetical protein